MLFQNNQIHQQYCNKEISNFEDGTIIEGPKPPIKKSNVRAVSASIIRKK